MQLSWACLCCPNIPDGAVPGAKVNLSESLV